jgi:hypothetical protein
LVVTCAAPVELLLAARPNAHDPLDRSWGLYAGLLAEAGIHEPASVDHPDVTCGTLHGPLGRLAVLTNHGAADLRIDLCLPADAGAIRRYGPAGIETLGPGRRADEGLRVELDLPAHGFALVGWTGRA